MRLILLILQHCGFNNVLDVFSYITTVFENHPKRSHFYILILAFSIFYPIKSDLSGNTVLPQALGFNGHFLAFLMNFCPLKM